MHLCRKEQVPAWWCGLLGERRAKPSVGMDCTSQQPAVFSSASLPASREAHYETLVYHPEDKRALEVRQQSCAVGLCWQSLCWQSLC